MSDRLTAGLDLGSTTVKVLVIDRHGAEVAAVERPTPWRSAPHGATELDAAVLARTVQSLLGELAATLSHAGLGHVPVQALAVSGMGETGFVVDAAGSSVVPAIAWFDPRGTAQLAELPADLRQEFPSRTGLPLGVQVSAVKLLHQRDHGVVLAARQWLGLPEFVTTLLGGRRVAEVSLASRTGLIDQDTGRPWPEMLAHLGVGRDFLPPLVTAGTDLGPADRGLAARPIGRRPAHRRRPRPPGRR